MANTHKIFLAKLPIGSRLRVQSAFFLALGFIILTLFFLQSQSTKENEQADKTFFSTLKTIELTIDLLNKTNSKDLTPYQTVYNDIKPYFSQMKAGVNNTVFMLTKNGMAYFYNKQDTTSFENHTIYKSILQSSNTFGRVIVTAKNQKPSWVYFRYLQTYSAFVVIEVPEKEILSNTKEFLLILLLLYIVFLVLIWVSISITWISVSKSLQIIHKLLARMAVGEVIEVSEYAGHDEIGEILIAMTELAEGHVRTTKFANTIGKGELNINYKPLSSKDTLGIALLEMRDSLKKAQDDSAKRQVKDRKHNWNTQGLANFGDILRQNNTDIEELSSAVIKNLVLYLEANQGGFFIYDTSEDTDGVLKLTASFAYNRKKFYTKTIKSDEGLLGMCIQEKKIIYLNEIPDEYIEIRSGLGGANPRTLLIVPILLENEKLGAIEIASFNYIEPYQVEFVKKIALNVASTLAATKTNARTNKLLRNSQEQKEQMKAQEEAMQQNMEELKSIQEEAARKSAELVGTFAAINSTLGVIEFDSGGKIISANQFIAEKLNRRVENFLGLPQLEIIDKEDITLSEYNSFWTELWMGESKQIERKYKSENNKYLWFTEIYHPILDENKAILKILTIYLDISESKNNEEKLKQQAIQLGDTQTKMQNEQEKLRRINTKMKDKEDILRKALKQSKTAEMNSKKSFSEVIQKEEELQKTIADLNVIQEEMSEQKKEVELAYEKIQKSEKTLKKTLKNAKDKEIKILEQNQDMTSKQVELGSLNAKISAHERELQETFDKLEQKNQKLLESQAELESQKEKFEIAKEKLLANENFLKNSTKAAKKSQSSLDLENKKLKESIKKLKKQLKEYKKDSNE